MAQKVVSILAFICLLCTVRSRLGGRLLAQCACRGIGYGAAADTAYWPDEQGLAHARTRIGEGIDLLAAGGYWGYNQHCVDAKSDARDAGQLFRHLRVPMTGRIFDLVYTDASTPTARRRQPGWPARSSPGRYSHRQAAAERPHGTTGESPVTV